MLGEAFEMHEHMEQDELDAVRNVGMSITEPVVKMRKESASLVIEVYMPGVSMDDISISLKKDRMSVSAEKREDMHEMEEGFFRSRSLVKYYKANEALPARIMPEKAKVAYEGGILSIEAPLDEDVEKRTGKLIMEGGE